MTLSSLKFSLGSQATLLWLLAFFCSFGWIQSYEPEFLIATMIALFSAVVVGDAESIPARTWDVPSSPILLCGGLFWALCFVSIAVSDIVFVSWISFFHFSVLPMTILFFLVGQAPHRRLHLAWHGIRMVFAGLSLYVLAQYFFMPRVLTPIGRAHEPFRDPNSLAAVLSLGLFLTAGSFLKKDHRWRLWDALLLVLLAGAFWATGSRGAVLALLAMSGLLLAVTGIKGIGGKNWLIFAAVAAVTLLLTGLITPKADTGPFRVLSYPVLDGLKSAFADRGDIWAAALQIVGDHFWFGTGIGTFEFYYASVRSMTDTTYGYMAHNEPLQYMAEMGVLAPVLFYGVVLLAIFRTWSALKLVPRGDERRLLIMIPFCALAALVLHSHVTFNLHIQPVLLLGGFAFALWYHQTGLVRHEVPRLIRSPRFLNKNALEALFLIVWFVMSTLVAAPIYSQRLVQDAMQAIQSSDLHAFAERVNLSDTLSLGTNAQSYSLAVMMPLGFMAQTVKPVTPEDRKKFIAQSEELIAKGLAANPLSADLMQQKATLAQLTGNQVEAEAMLRRALAADPLNMQARMGLADYLDKTGRLKEAVTIMNAGLDFHYGPERAQAYMDYFIRTMILQEKLDGPLKSDGQSAGKAKAGAKQSAAQGSH